jgi:hypothetical protein
VTIANGLTRASFERARRTLAELQVEFGLALDTLGMLLHTYRAGVDHLQALYAKGKPYAQSPRTAGSLAAEVSHPRGSLLILRSPPHHYWIGGHAGRRAHHLSPAEHAPHSTLMTNPEHMR